MSAKITEKQADSIANDIYTEVYGHIDNKSFKAEKLAEISEWLIEGDLDDYTDNDPLIAEWREYDAADIKSHE